MPIATEVEILARNTKLHDIVNGFEVIAVDNKDKYTHITLETGTKVRRVLDAKITVVRDVLTEVEQAEKEAAKLADTLSFLERDVLRTIEKSYANLETARDKLQEASKWTIDSQWSYLQAYLEAVAWRDIWGMVERAVGSQPLDEPSPTLQDAVVAVAKEMRDGLLSNRWRGRSTSIVSNAAESVMAEAASAWLRSYGVVSLLRYAEQGTL